MKFYDEKLIFYTQKQPLSDLYSPQSFFDKQSKNNCEEKRKQNLKEREKFSI